MLGAIETMRLALPDYGRGHGVTRAEVVHLSGVFNLAVRRADIEVPAMMSPQIAGKHWCFIREDLPPDVVDYIQLHEVAHICAGDAQDPTYLQFSGPLPEAEEVADLAALVGFLDDDDTAHGVQHAENRIRARVDLQDYGWQVHRVGELAPKVIRVKRLMQDWLDDV